MWIIIAAAGTGICLYQLIFLLPDVKKKELLETRLNTICVIGEKDNHYVRRWEGSLLSRAGKAIFMRLVSLAGSLLPVSAKERDRLRYLIARSGLRMQPEEYIVMQILVVAGGGLAGAYLGSVFDKGLLLSMAAGVYGGYTIFRFVIKSKSSTRQEAILEQLPELLDLLSISVEAGLGFNQAFHYIAEQCEGPLADEFVLAGRTMSLGRSKRIALGEMGQRCGLEEVQTFTSAVIQAEEMGISLKNILTVQAAQARNAKRMRTEERAQKIPIKMLIPLGLLIFPVMLIILMAPAVPVIMEALY